MIPAANESFNDRPPERASDRAQFILAVQKASRKAYGSGFMLGWIVATVLHFAVPAFLTWWLR